VITRTLSLALVLLGLVMLVRTAVEGVGGGLGFLLGGLLVLAGVARLYLGGAR
jgi:hypothetical protein